MIGGYLYNPKTSWVGKKSEKAEQKIYLCKESERCPLLKSNQCIHWPLFSRCIFGSITKEIGYTQRAKKFNGWIEEKKEKYGHLKSLKSPTRQITVIGDYVWIPYAHVTMQGSIPFLGHTSFLLEGTPFIHVKNFCADVMVKLIKFRPISLMGREIKTYQSVEVPKILRDLEINYPTLYSEIMVCLSKE